ncbi:MAG: nucleoside triphosphate pyrophosphatase [Victivallaceae bacterium]
MPEPRRKHEMLILGSSSPRRRELLARRGVFFRVEAAQVEELQTANPVADLPKLNAALKAAELAARFPEALVIGADTVILFDGRVIGKPRDRADALAILNALSGQIHEVVTGVALRRIAPPVDEVFAVSTRVRFKSYSPEVAARYLDKVEVLDKAGAYAIQEHGDDLVQAIEGPLDNVIGLPCDELLRRLEKYR